MAESIEVRARRLCRPVSMHEHLACRECQHYLSARVHPQLFVCCGCGRSTSTQGELGSVLREAFL